MHLQEFKHQYSVQMRWGDADRLGHINNATYFTYLECGRTHYMANVVPADATAGLWKTQGPILADMQCSFRRELHAPGDVIVATRFTPGERSTAVVTAGLFLPAYPEEPVATSKAVIVWMDYVNGSSILLPEAVRQAIEAFESGEMVLSAR